MRKLVVGFPPSRVVSRRFVAGETLDEAMSAVRALRSQGLGVTLDILGESVTKEEDARAARDAYLRTLDALAEGGITSNVSVKLTQMGLDISPDLCLDNMRRIVERAGGIGALTRIDMEGSRHTQATLDVFRTLRGESANLGIVIQAYLRRSAEDMRALREMGANVRLCKGAYKEPPEIAFPDKRDVDASFAGLAEAFLDPRGIPSTAFLAIATHDENLIDRIKRYAAAQGLGNRRFEFQMLYGIRPRLQRQLVAEGYHVRVYVPYGSHWYPYFMRRLAERPANVVFLVSNLFRR